MAGGKSLAELMGDGAKEFSRGVCGPLDAVVVGLQQDGAMTWFRLQGRDGCGWRALWRLVSSSGLLTADMMM